MNSIKQLFFLVPFFMHIAFPAHSCFKDVVPYSVNDSSRSSSSEAALFDLSLSEVDCSQSLKRQCLLRSKNCDVSGQQVLSDAGFSSLAEYSTSVTEFDAQDLLDAHWSKKAVGRAGCFICPGENCSLAPASKGDLIKHIESKHPELCSSSACDVCHKKFFTQGRFEKHIDYACSKCAYVTHRRHDLDLHENRHRLKIESGRKRSRYSGASSSSSSAPVDLELSCTCKLCAQICETPDLLWAHLFEKHVVKKEQADSKISFVCAASECEQIYVRKNALGEHIERNHPELCAMVCKICPKPKGFLTRARFSGHVHHRCSLEGCGYVTDRKGDRDLHEIRHKERIEQGCLR